MKEAETYTIPNVPRLFEKEKYTSIYIKQPTTGKLTTLATSVKKKGVFSAIGMDMIKLSVKHLVIKLPKRRITLLKVNHYVMGA